MNGTVVDIPGITVSIGVVSAEHGPDQAHTIEIKDSHGQTAKIVVAFGRITDFEIKPLR